jgi:beta-aspartyl-peptidase (threonine type)
VIIVASSNARIGFGAGMDRLRAGGSVLDAVEAVIRLVESNPDDHSVGYSGLPNLLGEVELDASIMEGASRAAGAVGALKGYEHAISVARKVMEELPHVMLVGEGAARFAAEFGFEPRDLLTPEALAIWGQGRARQTAADDRYMQRMTALARHAADPERPNETVNVIAMDARGDIACGVSTSGWAWKYPGRIGDSPIIAAGNYADNRYGAAACTGRGEMAIRAATAHSVVLFLKMGLSLEEALAEALRDLNGLSDPYFGQVSIVALDRHGRHGAASNRPGVTYIYQQGDMAEPAEAPRLTVAPAADAIS